MRGAFFGGMVWLRQTDRPGSGSFVLKIDGEKSALA
jgi:hypothetical protein